MRLREQVSAGLCALAIALGIFAVGGRPRWAQLLVALTLAGALVPLVTSSRAFARRSPLVVLAGLAGVLCAIQLLPLPHAVLAAFDPNGTALRDDGAALAGFAPAHTITLDVPGTLGALSFFASLLALAIVASRISTSERGRYRIIATVAALCGCYALVCGVHALLRTDALYGVYTDTGGQQLLGPLINGNQTACLMAIGTALAIGLMMYRRQRGVVRAAWGLVAIGCAVACLLTLSRGGALALGAGCFVAIALLIGQHFAARETPHARRSNFLSSSLPIGVVSVCAVIVVIYASAGGVKAQFTRTSLTELNAPRSKFAAWQSSAALVEESPWVGIGRGAFEPVFQRVHPASAYATYTHLENEYLQAVVDWGVPAALAFAAATIWLIAAAARRWRDGPLAAGALSALAVVLLQSNVDFGIEFLGIAAPMTAVAATLVHVPLSELRPNRIAIARGTRLGLIAALLAGACLLATSATTTIADDHDALVRDPSRASADVARHPFDYYGYARLAEAALHTDAPQAARLLNHAMRLHPTDPGLHLAAARMLYDSKYRAQAPIEYAAALDGARDPRAIVAEVAHRFPAAVAATAIPTDPRRVDAWLKTLDDLGYQDIALVWLERVALLQPNAPRVCEQLFATVAKRADLDAFGRAKERCGEYEPTYETRVALARALASKHAEAAIPPLLADVEDWRDETDEKAAAWQILCEAELALHKNEDAERCLHRLDASGIVPRQLAGTIADDLAKVAEQQRERAGGSGAK